MRCLALLLTVLIAAAIDAKPLPKAPPATPAEIKPGENLRLGPTIMGTLERAGAHIRFDGHPFWFGEGEIRADGLVRVFWFYRDTGELWVGVYRISSDGVLVGQWCRGDRCQFEPDGTLGTANPSHHITAPEPSDPAITDFL